MSSITTAVTVSNLDTIWKSFLESSEGLLCRMDKVLDHFDQDLASFGNEYANFTGMDETEIEEFFDKALEELNRQSKLALLSVTEGHIRFDVAFRLNNSTPGPMTPHFQALYAQARSDIGRIKIRKILDGWKTPGGVSAIEIDEYKDMLDPRNWLAHGGWEESDPTWKTDPYDVREIVVNLMITLPLNVTIAS